MYATNVFATPTKNVEIKYLLWIKYRKQEMRDHYKSYMLQLLASTLNIATKLLPVSINKNKQTQMLNANISAPTSSALQCRVPFSGERIYDRTYNLI